MDRYREFSLKSILLALAAAFLTSSCGGSGGSGEPAPPAPPAEPPSLSVSPASIEVEAGGGEISADVSNSGEGTLNWTASVPSGVDWARISGESSGANSGSITIAVDANTGAAREFELSVSAGSAGSATVTISQAEASPSLSVSPAGIDVEAGGGEVSADVSNNGGGSLNWTASIPAGVGWARISSGTSGTNAGTITVELDANTGAAREFELSVSAGSAGSETVTISQAQAPAVIELSADDTALDGEGGSVTLQVRNTGFGAMNWTARLPQDVDWAYIESGETGTDAGEIVVQYDINGGADRELEVTVAAIAASNSPQSLSLGQQWFATGACTYPEARQEVLDLMEEFYYFNDESAQAARYDEIVLEDHDTLDSILDELRWMPETHDRGFTYWQTRKEWEDLSNAEASIFGFRMTVIVDANQNPVHLEVLDVYGGSPAGAAGLERGDKIRSLNGKAINGLSIEEIGNEFGPNTEGHVVAFGTEKLSGERRTFDMAKARVQIPTVPDEHVEVFDSDAGKVGYLHFRTFFGDAPGRLLDEFAGFKSQGVRNLIVDLRYNGGGLVWIAHALATLIGGPELFESGPTTEMSRQVHNQLNAWRNSTSYFDCGAFGSPSLAAKCRNESSLRGLDNVVFITGRGSASASELVITALQPYENVALVGERTFGKPVGQYGLDFCPPVFRSGMALLWPVSFATQNSEQFEDYYDGIAVDCEVPDDRASPLGSAEEGRIAAALNYIETGNCGVRATAREQEAIQMPPLDPVQQFLGH